MDAKTIFTEARKLFFFGCLSFFGVRSFFDLLWWLLEKLTGA